MDNERYLISKNRIADISVDPALPAPYGGYFQDMASFLLQIFAQSDFVTSGEILRATVAELAKRNHALYADILPEHYGQSYANPTYAEACFGREMGQGLCFLYAELRSLVVYAHERREDLILLRCELFLQIYDTFVSTVTTGPSAEVTAPSSATIKHILAQYVNNHMPSALREKIGGMVGYCADFASPIIKEADLADPRYLYYYGEYITENELATAAHLNNLPAETIATMAATFTEGYRKGFVVCGKDMAKKQVVNIYYRLGFERMIRQAAANFREMGLEAVYSRTNLSVLEGRSAERVGFHGAYANKQYDFDHKDDQALLLDEALMKARLAALEEAYESVKEAAKGYAGPAALETFGELPPPPEYKDAALRLSPEQQGLVVSYSLQATNIANRYIPREETSYTIIAFPTPDIGPRFAEVFNDTIALNTLDYELYRDIQQLIIDCLDRAAYVEVTGKGANKTALKIALPPLSDPVSQTNFENCVADVNIPVGEVFTSPQLKGTEGVLHVTKVYLDGIEYKELTLSVADGMVVDYNCTNSPDMAKNRQLIKENVLNHHETLPMGEFAIGTNTTAYMVGKKYGIADRLPILIAEKTGPHFAFGDTCYSHAEDIAVYNPDGKEIVARDNEVSLTRKEGSIKAYYGCHTDVTIPYDELGAITAVTKEGEKLAIFAEGRFVLAGCGEINVALQKSS
ncbi:MAG: aminopeptidase [Lachnospiraceae bacterium]|jgi:leucyl aminopeptidase (aminopeptidase T)|nr:aminopeptidase [Lachnospiraceae bacterium]